jgi:putative ABC transport system permease protein
MLKLKPSLDDLIKSSIRSILKNKVRTFLTSLGIIIGVTSVILLVSIGNGLKDFVVEQFDSLGSNIVYVMPGKMFSGNGEGFAGGGQSMMNNSFKEKDLTNLTRKLDIEAIFPMIETRAEVKYLTNSKKTSLEITNYQYGKSMNSLPSSGNGRWFTKAEENKNSKVVILGYNVKDELFGKSNPLNKKINISGHTFKVIGYLDQKGRGLGGASIDDAVYIPLNVSYNIVGHKNIQSIGIKVKDKEDIEKIKKQTEEILKKDYKKEDSFSVVDQSQILSSINTILSTLTVALSGIAAISLIVGGIGIMNIMLVTVTERTKEIGLRKAVGAYPQAILLQFLIEAIILSCLGGGIGIILGSLGSWGIDKIFPAKVTLESIILAFGVSTIVGIIFGVAPARKASKLSPIEALRYE